MFYLTTHSTHYIYRYMASDIWYRTTQIVREETHCCHMGYSFWLAARILLYAMAGTRPKTSKTASVLKWIETNKVYLFVSVAFICFVLYLRKIILSKICILHCLVPLNIVLFKPCLFPITTEKNDQCIYHYTWFAIFWCKFPNSCVILLKQTKSV